MRHYYSSQHSELNPDNSNRLHVAIIGERVGDWKFFLTVPHGRPARVMIVAVAVTPHLARYAASAFLAIVEAGYCWAGGYRSNDRGDFAKMRASANPCFALAVHLDHSAKSNRDALAGSPESNSD